MTYSRCFSGNMHLYLPACTFNHDALVFFWASYAISLTRSHIHYDVLQVLFGPLMHLHLPARAFTRSYDVLQVFLGRGLVVSHGDEWFRERKLLTPLFHFKSLKTQIFDDMLHRLPSVMRNLEWEPKTEYKFAFDVLSRCTLEVKLCGCVTYTLGAQTCVRRAILFF